MTDTGPCDYACPQTPAFRPLVAPCCHNCATARKYFVTEQNKNLWTDERGFLGPQGCNLPREAMPQECKTYDCKKDTFYVCTLEYAPLVWREDRWTQLEAIRGVFVGEIRNIKELLWTIGKQLEMRNKDL